jgi:membrane-bound serine protease (ClpP class)
MGGFILAALAFSGLSVFTAMKQSEAAGYVMLAVNVVLFPAAFLIGVKVLRRSPMIHNLQMSTGVQTSPEALPLSQLRGEIGRAITPLRPSGAAMINDKKVDVVTESKFVEAGSIVKVIRVEGNIVVVEPV